MADGWTVRDPERGNERSVGSRSEAEEAKNELADLGIDAEIIPPGENGDEPEAVEPGEVVEVQPSPDDEEFTPASDLAERSVAEDPLSFLPAYMIDEVKGTPTLNKRGLSVLAFHYGVTVIDREIIASPHETDWESAIVETTVRNSDGNEFVGTGTAHVDRGDDKEVLLELAETRSYKRAVSFATGTGIVSYQEMVSEVE